MGAEGSAAEAVPERSGVGDDMLQRARAGTRGGKSRRENRSPAEKGGRVVAVGAWVIYGQVTATFCVCSSLWGGVRKRQTAREGILSGRFDRGFVGIKRALSIGGIKHASVFGTSSTKCVSALVAECPVSQGRITFRRSVFNIGVGWEGANIGQ